MYRYQMQPDYGQHANPITAVVITHVQQMGSWKSAFGQEPIFLPCTQRRHKVLLYSQCSWTFHSALFSQCRKLAVMCHVA